MKLSRRAFTGSLLGAAAGSAVLHPGMLRGVTAVSGDAEERGAWFRAARFGMFIHFGLYSQLGRGEWVMHREGIPVERYEKLIHEFNPSQFSAKAWVDLARAAGQRYMTITTKHHEGFCMFASKLTPYNITNTPYGKDFLKELSDECHRQQMPLFFYYSLMDWHHPDYRQSMQPNTPVSPAFINYLKGQITELCTNYGTVAGFWFDGDWDHSGEQWHSEEILQIIRRLQPQALVNNRLNMKGLGDFATPEQQLGTPPKRGDNQLRESCMTINDNWGYAKTDQRFKSTRELIQILALAAGGDTNLLLDVGPQPDGVIQAEYAERLRGMGAWLQRNGESIYGTRTTYNGYYYDTTQTHNDNKYYFHIFDWEPGTSLRIDLDLPKPPARVYMLETGRDLPVVHNPSHGGGLSGYLSVDTYNAGWSGDDAVIVAEI
jgi:alpha-L-fucosidase